MVDQRTNDPSPVLTPDIFSVSRRFDMATILVAMLGYSILFAGLRMLDAPPYLIGLAGVFFAFVAVGQAVAIRWNNPRTASIIAGGVFWFLFTTIEVVRDDFPFSPCAALGAIFVCMLFGPVSGYLAGTLVGGVFLISHHLREASLFRRRAAQSEAVGESPWGAIPKPVTPDDDYDWPVMIEVPPNDERPA